MRDWSDFGVWEERHKELMREAEDRRLVREMRGQPVAGRWKRLLGLLGLTAVPFVGLLRH
jgi:hypothetical protein